MPQIRNIRLAAYVTKKTKKELEKETYTMFKLRQKLGIQPESTPEEVELIQRGAQHENKDLEDVGEIKEKHDIVNEYWYRRH